MTILRTSGRSAVLAAVALFHAVNAPVSVAGEGGEYEPLKNDPRLVLGFRSCAKCHDAEISRWQQTPHYKTFRALHRVPEAKQIAQRLGLTSIKRNDLCIQCHYTQQHQDGHVKAISGISCESCHGAGKNWLDVHHDYGGPQATKESESSAHRAHRLQTSIAQGMRNPANVYLIARSCYNCHTVPHEKLVNVGGHRAGTKDFELVAWSQGLVRHNYLRSGGKTNLVSDRGRLRVMYVVGVMTDLEYSLRATAKATKKDRYGMVSARRAARMNKRLQGLQKRISNEHVAAALEAFAGVKLRLNNGSQLLVAAEEVSVAARRFSEEMDGGDLAAIDPLLPSPDQYK